MSRIIVKNLPSGVSELLILVDSYSDRFILIRRDNLLEHFKQNKYFSDRQFGFLKGRSTVTQLLSMLQLD